jgi:hypothetical protein
MLKQPVVVAKNDTPGVWAVEQIDETNDDCYTTVFYGPSSEERARAYAEFLELKSGP